MGSVNLVVIVESVRSLATKPSDGLKEFHLASILAVAAALGTYHIFYRGYVITSQMQASNLFSSCTATRFVENPVKWQCFGKIIGMIYSSTDSVGSANIEP
jgi:hypothetical protein